MNDSIRSDRVRQFVVTASAVFMIVGTLFGIGVFGTRVEETAGGSLSATATLLAPAVRAFSIWSVIYAGLIAYVVWQWLPANTASPRARAIGWLASASMVLNAAWLLVTQVSWLWASVAIIVALAVTLGLLMQRLSEIPAGVGEAAVSEASSGSAIVGGSGSAIVGGLGEASSGSAIARGAGSASSGSAIARGSGSAIVGGPSWVERVVVDGTFGLYLGWVSVATAANITATLVASGVNPGGTVSEIVAVAVLAVAAGLGVLLAREFGGRIGVAAAMAWGLSWIAVGRFAGEPNSALTGIAAALAALVVVAAALVWARRPVQLAQARSAS